MQDAIIIGGGPSGSTLATYLAHQGHSVCVLERERFPREHVGESLLPFTYDIFEDLGVLEEMKGRFSRKPGVTFSNVDGSRQSHWCFERVIDGPQSLSFHVRRAEFDNVLLRNSEKNGAQVIEEARVTAIDLEQNSVTYSDASGEANTLQAKFIIDASGQAAVMARMMKNQKPFSRLNIRQAISTHWKNVNANESLAEKNIEIVHLGGEKLGWIWLIPLVDCLSIGVALNMSYAQEQRKKLVAEGHENWAQTLYMQEILSSPEVAAIIDGAEQEHEVNLNGDFSYYAEQKFGDNFAMVGDSAAFLDPIFSSGIYLGMKSAQLLSPGISQAIQGQGTASIAACYDQLAQGYKVVEELICTFYQEESLSFSDLNGKEHFSFDHFESSYSILHLILAGDFFTDAEKYLKAIHLLKKSNNLERFKSLIGHGDARELQKVCVNPQR